jgi:phosphotransacetylase
MTLKEQINWFLIGTANTLEESIDSLPEVQNKLLLVAIYNQCDYCDYEARMIEDYLKKHKIKGFKKQIAKINTQTKLLFKLLEERFNELGTSN